MSTQEETRTLTPCGIRTSSVLVYHSNTWASFDPGKLILTGIPAFVVYFLATAKTNTRAYDHKDAIFLLIIKIKA